MRWERKAANYGALVLFASGLVAFQQGNEWVLLILYGLALRENPQSWHVYEYESKHCQENVASILTAC